MIHVTRLLFDTPAPGDGLRYGVEAAPAHGRPVVVWNATRRCNLSCAHCYSDSADRGYAGELSTEEARRMIEALGSFGVPVLLLSGGEPLMRGDILELIPLAKAAGLRTILSTNGTLITRDVARRIREAGADYAGVSLDGVGEVNDRFRGKRGAFDMALAGIRNLMEEGVRTGIRFTLTRRNCGELAGIFDLAEREGIPRICVYHLAYAGRGSRMRENDLGHTETRRCLDLIFERAAAMARRGAEVLTVDNHADGPYLYLRLRSADAARAGEAMRLLRLNGGNSSGIGIACVGSTGDVHPDQFWRQHSLGNVRARPFGDIWSDPSCELLRMLRDRKHLLKGRCARCRFLDVCNGNLRARAEAVHGDIWADDPACYLTDEEIR